MTSVRSRFDPSVTSGRRARRAIARRLHESLDHIFRQSEGIVEFDGPRAAALLRLTQCAKRLPPGLFSRYFALVETIENGTLGEAEAALARLLEHVEPAPPALQVRPLVPEAFTSAEESELRRDFASESLLEEQIERLEPASAREVVAQFSRALGLLRAHAPRTFGEIGEVVTELVAARGKPSGGMSFDGCSSLERWGSVLINAGRTRTDLALAEVITHECAHNALFALTATDARVENDPEERYSSPLRIDPRPMDGIYHATFVLARMCFAMDEVAASPTADPSLKAEARELARASAAAFESGYGVLEPNARYTAVGRAIIEDAAAYMRRRSPSGSGAAAAAPS